MAYRDRQLRNLAASHGYAFSDEDDHGLTSKLADFRLTSRGRSAKVTNVLRMQHGMMAYDVRVFDYSYREWVGKKNDGVHQTVFFIESQQLGLPELRMQPETIVHKLGELLGYGDIDFIRFPKFSSNYRLLGEDEVFIRHHFTDDVLNFFTLHRGWSLETLGYYLLFYKKGFLLPPDQIPTLFTKGMEVFDLFRSPDVASRP